MLAKSVHALRVWIPGLALDQEPDIRYHDSDAEACARRTLIPARPFRASAQLTDEQLAAAFGVPVSKIADRRAEFHAGQHGPRPGRLCQGLGAPGVCELADTLDARPRRRRDRRPPRR